MKCKAFLLAEYIDLNKSPSDKKFREVNLINTENNKYFVFPYGVVVCWGDGDISDALVLLKDYLTEPISSEQRVSDTYSVVMNSDNKKLFERDTIYLDEDDDSKMLAVSHPFAQSLRLIEIEDKTIESIKKISHIPKDLAENGKIRESKKSIFKLQGHLYSLKSKISLEYSILDKPEFFWENPEFDHYYVQVANYLELPARIEVVNRKMETIDQILSILSDELNHRHSTKLEVIIIVLILVEVITFFLKDIFKLIN